MGGNVADFVIVKDTGFNLPSGTPPDPDITLPSFGLPGDTAVGTRSILSFRVTGNATLSATINGTEVLPPTALGSGGANVTRGFQEAIRETNILKNGPGNEVGFRVTAGSCRISDVILWFQNAV